MSFQDKEGVENAVLKAVGLGSREAASLHSNPSHGRNYRVVVALKKKGQGHQTLSKYLGIHCLSHWAGYFGSGHNFCLQKS